MDNAKCTTGVDYQCYSLSQNQDLLSIFFVDFKGYVDFFFLQDCVSEDYSSVNIWMGDASFRKSGLPETVEDYFRFLLKEHIFLDKRNRRIQDYCIKNDIL